MRRTILTLGGILFGLFLLLWGMKQAEAPSAHTFRDTAPVIPPNDFLAPHDFKREGVMLRIGETIIAVELAITAEERMLGLGGRERIAPNSGMLFVFPKSGAHPIWMKNMRFPLDIIWLAPIPPAPQTFGKLPEAFVVVDMKEDVAPETFPKAFFPETEAAYVLEMRGDEAKKIGIELGSILTLTE